MSDRDTPEDGTAAGRPGDGADARLDATIDALFRRAAASAPGGSAVGWDERADVTVERALSDPASQADLDAILAAPALAPEPGEDLVFSPSGEPTRAAPTSGRGGNDRNSRTMSDDNPKPPSSRRPSLKELAESVKNRPSSPGGPSSQRPPPSLKDTLVALESKVPAPPSVRPPQSSQPSSAPGSERLSSPGAIAAAPTSAPPSSLPAPSSRPAPSSGPGPSSAPTSTPVSTAAPSSAGAPVASAPATKPSATARPASSGTNKAIGAVFFLAAAAAAAFALTRPAAEAPAPAAVAQAAPTAAPAADAPEEVEPAGEPPAEPTKPEGVIDISQLADADAAASAAPVAVGGPLPTGPAPSASAVAKNDAKTEPKAPAGPGEDLDEAIRNRAGGGDDDDAVEAEPAAGEPRRKNVPDVPPTGAVTSALNAVKGSAKGCVAGADEPSSATVTFSSSGSVQSVSVGGWAAGKGAAACIKSAMSAARVPPFAKPTYSTSVTIRP